MNKTDTLSSDDPLQDQRTIEHDFSDLHVEQRHGPETRGPVGDDFGTSTWYFEQRPMTSVSRKQQVKSGSVK